MNYRKAFISTCHYGWHKGFYNDGDYSSALGHIKYTDFFDGLGCGDKLLFYILIFYIFNHNTDW